MLLGSIFDHFGLHLASPGSLLGAFGVLGAALRRPWGILRAPLSPSGLPLGHPGAPFLPKLTPEASQNTFWTTFYHSNSLKVT